MKKSVQSKSKIGEMTPKEILAKYKSAAICRARKYTKGRH